MGLQWQFLASLGAPGVSPAKPRLRAPPSTCRPKPLLPLCPNRTPRFPNSPSTRRPGFPRRPEPNRQLFVGIVPLCDRDRPFLALSPVSSTKRTTGLSFGQVSNNPLSHRPAGFGAVYPVVAMNRCIPRSTAAGFPAKGSFLAAALSPHPSSLAIPNLKAASALVWGLDRCGMFFRILSVHWYNTDCWLTGRPHFGLAALQSWSDLFRESTFSQTPLKKCRAASPLTGGLARG